MSWDVVLFNSIEKITDIESLDDSKLIPFNFEQAFENYFTEIKKANDAWQVNRNGFTIVHYPSNEAVTNCLINLYGENAIYAIAHLAQINN